MQTTQTAHWPNLNQRDLQLIQHGLRLAAEDAKRRMQNYARKGEEEGVLGATRMKNQANKLAQKAEELSLSI